MQKTFRIENDKLTLQSLQVPMVNHCINHCVACASFSPISPKGFLDKDIIRRDILDMKEVFDIDIFYLFGGEPLLHPDLIEIMDIVKESKIAKTLSILTNGQLLLTMKKDFWDKIDCINLARYPEKISERDYVKIIKKCQDLNKQFIPVEVCFSKIGSFKRADDIKTQKIFDGCYSGGWCITFYDGWLYLCCQLYYFKKFIDRDSNDGIKIKDLTKEKLIEYLCTVKPPELCHYCTGIFDMNQKRIHEIKWEECRDENWWTRSFTDYF